MWICETLTRSYALPYFPPFVYSMFFDNERAWNIISSNRTFSFSPCLVCSDRALLTPRQQVLTWWDRISHKTFCKSIADMTELRINRIIIAYRVSITKEYYSHYHRVSGPRYVGDDCRYLGMYRGTNAFCQLTTRCVQGYLRVCIICPTYFKVKLLILSTDKLNRLQ